MLSDARGLYGRLTARENIAYYGELRAMEPAAVQASIARLAELLDMKALLDRRTDGFSQGERMKVAIARALVHDPPNVILDEPSNGLDVMTTRNLREVIRNLRAQGKCVLFSSHVMQEVSALCDEIVIVAHGAVAAHGTPERLLAASGCANLEDAFVHLAGGGLAPCARAARYSPCISRSCATRCATGAPRSWCSSLPSSPGRSRWCSWRISSRASRKRRRRSRCACAAPSTRRRS
jgi:sodium transport system ATP-binding protein